MRNVRRQIADIEHHQQLTMRQHAAYIAARASLAPEHALVTIDFTKMALPDTMKVLVALVVVIEFLKDGVLTRQYVDLLTQTDKADIFFVIAGVRYLLEQTSVFNPFLFLHFWSDGAVHQFKNRFVQRFMSCLPVLYKKVASYDYFTAHHGKSLTDSHAYHLKRAATQLYLHHEAAANRLQQIGLAGGIDPEPGISPFSVKLSEVKSFIETTVGRTLALVMPVIERHSSWKSECTKIVGIKKMHSFSYVAVWDNGTILLLVIPAAYTGGPKLPLVANRISLISSST